MKGDKEARKAEKHDKQLNNCDGCIAGYPVENGRHVVPNEKNPWLKTHMVCSAYRYR